jgi:indole-3-glycerol phosphate synthase
MKLGFSPCFLEDLKGGDANTNAAILEEVLKGKEGTLHQSAIADTLILNAAAALWIYGKTSSIEAGIPIVRATLEEGKALKTLETWKALSSSKPSRNYLEDILHFKKQEVETRLKELEKNPSHPLHHLLEKGKPCSHLFSKALKQHSLSIIAEVKRHSPSLGKIHEIQDPMALALRYCQGGASAISVLTDPYAFKGSLEDLKVISEMLSKKYPSIPTLRKDFIIHPIQLAEAALAGASAALLIACILKEKLKFFIEEASRLGLETLTEVHDLEDLEYALNAKAPIIGVNHRNLKTFEIDLTLSKELKPLIPSSVITVAESGIHTPAAAEQMHLRGYDAILVGEALVRSEDPSQLLTSMKQKPSIHVKICRVTHPEDAELAAKLGATYIGIIFSKKSKYPISVPQGKEISRAARKGGAIPVAVFVDESLEDILSICKEAQITAVQLHGDPSRKIFSFLPKEFTIFYTIPVHPDGSFENIPDLPKDIYLLFDSSKAGSGHSFDWNHFHPPKDRPFILAGGLNPNNVKQAIDLLHPAIVDVASGVEYPQDRRKDPLLIKSFIHASSKETL